MTSFTGLVHDLQEASSAFSNANDASNESDTMILSELEAFSKEAMSYRNQALYLSKKTQSTAQSMVDALNLGFQQLAQSQSKDTSSMAKAARKDSVAIRAITFVTSFYLPFSFVAVGWILS